MNEFKGYFNNTSSFKGKLDTAVIEIKPELEDIEITPKNEEQNFKSEKYGYNNVKVKAVEGEKLNVIPSDEKQQYNGLYTEVDIDAIESEEITLIPTTEEQIKEGLYNKVTLVGDENFIAGNIKQGVTIFGKDGTYVASGGDGGGADLSTIGTTVTVEAMTAIVKGQRLYCVPNEEFSQNNIGYSNVSNVPAQLSDDLVVGLDTQTISTATESVSLLFWDNVNNTYEKVDIPIEGWTGSSSKSCSLNPEGTLAMFWYNSSSAPSSTQKALVLEIDKENKTANPYMVTVGSTFRPLYSASICRCIFKNYVFDYASKTKIHRYNFETHDFTTLTCTNNTEPSYTPSNSSNMGRTKWLSDDTLIYSANGLSKFVFNSDDTFTYSKSSQGNLNGNLNEDCTMMVASANSYYRFYSINPSDLTITLIADYTPDDIGESAYSTTCQIYGNLLFTNNNIHDITNVASGTTIIYTSSFRISAGKTINFNPNAWVSTISSSDIRRLHYPQGSEAQYLAYHSGNTAMTSGRAYGIASSNMSAGDKGTAQLLFTT